MKTLLILSALTLSSLACAAPDPCKLLTPGEVQSGLGAPTVTAKPATDQDIPTCNFDFKDGGLSLGVTAGAGKMLGGKSLLSLLQSGGEGGTPMKGVKAVPGVGDEAAGGGASQTTSGVAQDFATLYLRRGDTLLVFMAVSSNHAASKLNLQSLTLLARRALLRLP
ncbi:hypothetical protein [Deinococcus aluminii]|uniref:Uncharacterized protein n=1 Tax=Deinococcus aluminii TaxID=1656885 RepID=A0ABP9XHZ5_9DEIO